MTPRPCAVIPVYNHHRHLGEVVAALRAQALPVLLVDDGSESVTARTIDALATQDGVECLRLEHNRGKGAAVLAGIAHVAAQGFTHALQVDADGQHDLADAPRLLDLAARHPHHLVSGTPRYDDSVPAVRFYGRYLTHALVWLETLSLSLVDSMCGFRVYPATETLALMQRSRIGARMDFDTDIMVRLYRAGVESVFLPTRVHYPQDGVSHFRMLRDNLRMTWLHVRLLASLPWHAPALLRRTLARRRRQLQGEAMP